MSVQLGKGATIRNWFSRDASSQQLRYNEGVTRVILKMRSMQCTRTPCNETHVSEGGPLKHRESGHGKHTTVDVIGDRYSSKCKLHELLANKISTPSEMYVCVKVTPLADQPTSATAAARCKKKDGRKCGIKRGTPLVRRA